MDESAAILEDRVEALQRAGDFGRLQDALRLVDRRDQGARELVERQRCERIGDLLDLCRPLLDVGRDGGHLPDVLVEAAQHDRRAGEVVEGDVQDSGHEALHAELRAQMAFLNHSSERVVEVAGSDSLQGVRFEVGVHSGQPVAPAHIDVGHFADANATHQDWCSFLKTGHGRIEVHHDMVLGLEHPGAAPEHEAGHDQNASPQNESADDGWIRSHTHDVIPPAAPLVSPRRRNVRTVGFGLSSRSFFGGPQAIMVRVSASRNTALSAMVKMLASSCVTTTMVAPRLARSSMMRSSSRRELIGSSPADGSSKNRMSGSSAMARATPARFSMPPLTSEG